MGTPQSVEQMRTTASPFSGAPEMKRPDHGSEQAEQEHGFEWVELIRIAFVAFAAAAVWTNGLANFAERIAKLRWSGTASTTLQP